ncbi:hypothetical protein AB0I67_42510, partial [Nonomuraea sp. NPDC050310]
MYDNDIVCGSCGRREGHPEWCDLGGLTTREQLAQENQAWRTHKEEHRYLTERVDGCDFCLLDPPSFGARVTPAGQQELNAASERCRMRGGPPWSSSTPSAPRSSPRTPSPEGRASGPFPETGRPTAPYPGHDETPPPDPKGSSGGDVVYTLVLEGAAGDDTVTGLPWWPAPRGGHHRCRGRRHRSP